MKNIMGNQIRMLRKAKGVTQEELGQALGISYQAVSKWENDTALPDVQTIPRIAEYFGVTTDELFGYKLNALTNKERLIQFMLNNQILKLGDVQLKHGGPATYYIDTENFSANSQIAKLGEYFADCIKENHLEFDTLMGLAYHGIAFSCATAASLYNKYGTTVNYCYSRRVPDKQGRNICGHTLQPGERVVIIDDVLTTGTSLATTIRELKESAGITVAAVIVVANRRTQSASYEESGEYKIRQEFDAEVYSLLTDEDINAYLEKKIG